VAKKKVILILTVFDDGTHSIIEPDKETTASALDDTTVEDGNGGDRPPTGPKTP